VIIVWNVFSTQVLKIVPVGFKIPLISFYFVIFIKREMWSRSKFQPSIENAPVKSFWGSKSFAPKPVIPERESSSQPISFWSKYRYAKSTKSSTTTTTTTTTTLSTTTTTFPTTTTQETTTTSKAETTTWFDDLNDETCGKCESRFCTAVSNFAQFSDHLLDGDHVIDVKFPSKLKNLTLPGKMTIFFSFLFF
jgi:hypothetical protein